MQQKRMQYSTQSAEYAHGFDYKLQILNPCAIYLTRHTGYIYETVWKAVNYWLIWLNALKESCCFMSCVWLCMQALRAIYLNNNLTWFQYFKTYSIAMDNRFYI